MKSVNRITLLGNVGRDPEIKTTQSGLAIARFSLATSYKTKTQERTEWHSVVAFGKLAEIVQQYVAKGDKLYLEGRVEYTKTDEGKYYTDVIADQLVLLGGGNKAEAKPVAAAVSHDEPDELPF